MTTNANTPDNSRDDARDDVPHESGDENNDTETVQRADATKPLDVRPDPAPRHGVADLLDDRDRDDEPVAPPALTGTGSTHAHAVTPAPSAPRGPHVPAILLGVVCVAVAALVLAQELGDLTVDWGDIGPLGIALTGGVLVVFGLLGLATSRRKES
jgi:hypothetical protein